MTGTLIVSASGIRGVVGEGLTPEVAARYGAAFGAYLGGAAASVHAGESPTESGVRSRGGCIVVGRDSRVSGALLADAAAAGLRAAGWTVRDAGIAPTPTLLLAAQDLEDAHGALILTASHNPVGWNGLKLGSGDGRFVAPEAGRLVQELYGSGPCYVAWDRLGAREQLDDVGGHHVRRILALPILERAAIAAWAPRVAVDCVRGAGGVVLPRLLEELGCEVAGRNLEPDGRFPRNPEPTAAHLEEVGRFVRESGADLGMAVDPDGDRLALLDETGRPVGEDWTLALAVEYVLSRQTGPVVTNLSSSQSIEDAAIRHGAALHRTPVGEAHVARGMDRVGAVVGGEGNGGVMLPALHATRDAPLAAALVLGLLADRGVPLSELIGGWSDYHMVRRRAARPANGADDPLGRLERAIGAGASVDRTDGLRLSWPERREWVHVRPSGTEPIMRIIAEAPHEARARELAGDAEAACAES